MVQVRFPANSSPTRYGQESGGRLVNMFVSEVEGSPSSPLLWQAVPGMRETLTLDQQAGYEVTDINCRGLTTIGGTIMHIVNEACYAATQLSLTELQATRLGSLDGSHPLTFAQNNVQPVPDTWAVGNGAAWLIFSDSAPTSYDGGGNLVAPNSATNIDGYTIFASNGGKLQATDLNSTTLPSNSFEDVPEGNLRRVVTYKNEVFAFGEEFFRVYANTGQPTFPLEFTGVKADLGIAETFAIAGFENGWSGALIFAGSDNQIYRMQGYIPVPIGTDNIATAIEASDKDDLRAQAYVAGGFAFWNITDQENFTWEYNLQTGLWHERETYQRADWRGRSTVKKFDNWYVGDDVTGNLYVIIQGWPSDGPTPLVAEIEDGGLSQDGKRLVSPWTHCRFTAGVGIDTGLIPTQTAPLVTVFTSLDGGATYGGGIQYPLGNDGDHQRQVRLGNSGIAGPKGIRRRYQISDGVHVGLQGAESELEVLDA